MKLQILLILSLTLLLNAGNAEARRKRSTYRLPTHPVVLWAKTLAESTDPEQRKIAAFKLSQYTQPIFRIQTINSLLACMKDKDLHIRVLCTKALGGVKKHSYDQKIRTALLEQFEEFPKLKNTVVRTLTERKDGHSSVISELMSELKKAEDTEELVVLLKYFELFGDGSDSFVSTLSKTYKKNTNPRVQAAIVSALSERGKGQTEIVDLMVQCATSKNTPLQLTCLSGLESQARTDSRAWFALQNSLSSSDQDVVIASLDVINALPAQPNSQLAIRLTEIIEKIPDPEVREKGLLALGVTGDSSQPIVDTLRKNLNNSSGPEGVRIAAALVLGQQASNHSQAALHDLENCEKKEKSQSLRTACQLGIRELKKITEGKKSAKR